MFVRPLSSVRPVHPNRCDDQNQQHKEQNFERPIPTVRRDAKKPFDIVHYALRSTQACARCPLRMVADVDDGLFLLRDRLRRWEAPFSLENFLAWAIEPHHVVPALLDRQTIWNVAIAAAELDDNRAVGAFLSGNVVDRIGVS